MLKEAEMIFRCSLKKWKTRKNSGVVSLIIKDIPDGFDKFEDKPLIVNFNQMAQASAKIKNIEQLANGDHEVILITGKDSKRILINVGPKLKEMEEIRVKFEINKKEQQRLMNMITNSQRNKAFAIIEDMGDSIGYEKEEMKEALIMRFAEVSEHGRISLSDCSKKAAIDFIDFAIRLGYELGVQWEENPRKRLDSLDRWLRMCLDKKICAVSTKPGKNYYIDNSGEIVHVHHADAIGMGQNRQKFDDSNLKKICLSAEYHNIAHQMGWKSFKKKYHVEAIVYP
jgi:hypothetical protein